MTTNNALSIFDPANVPDHIRNFNDGHANIGDKQSVDSLSYPGKVWTVAMAGNKTPLMRTNEDGDQEPRQTIPLIILDYNKRRGRSYYAKGFEEGKPQLPDCWSSDSITPDPASTYRQSDKCATCPMAVKGSKTTDAGQPTTACSQFRMVAVQLYRKWDLPPLRLRLAVTSDYDGKNAKNEAEGWYAFSQLVDYLRSQGVRHTGSVVVKAKFDAAQKYPKVLFSATSLVTDEELDIIGPLSESPEVAALLSHTFTPNGSDGVKVGVDMPADEDAVAAPPPAAAAKPRQKAKPVVEPEPEPAPEEVQPEVGDEGEIGDIVGAAEEDEDDPEIAAAKAAQEARDKAIAKQQAKAAATVAASKRAARADDDDGEIVMTAPKPKTTAAAAAPAAKAAAPKATPVAPKAATKPAAGAPKPVSSKVGAMLQDWQDD